MEIIIEFILELLFETGIEASKSTKIPKFVRYPLIILICLIFLSIIFLIIYIGLSIIKDNIIGGIIVIIFGLAFLILSIYKFRTTYIKKTNK